MTKAAAVMSKLPAILERLALIDQFEKVLRDAGALRQQRLQLIEGERAWIVLERRTMLEATNNARAKRGLPPVEMYRVMAVERSAVGHIDYVHKFALGCAFLVEE